VRRRLVAFVATMMCVAGGAAPPVSAADAGTLGPDHQSTDPALRDAYNRAFQAMLADPGDLDKAFAFADLAIQIGDFEGAIAAMERMLLVNSNLPWVKLELGVLYYRLGSFAIARTYLQTALVAPNVPPALRERIRALLALIDQQEASNQFGRSLGHGVSASSILTGQDDSASIAVAWRFQK
jgi:tetratricopeptide (TPR) repeat protein